MLDLDLRQHHQQFISFLYAASVSTLVARVFMHQSQGTLDTEIQSYVLEIVLLVCAITFISGDWLARMRSRHRVALGANSLFTATVVEIAGLVAIIMAFGNTLTVTYLPPKTSPLNVILFGTFALATFVWECLIVHADPMSYRQLLRASLIGDVSKMSRVRTEWANTFRARLLSLWASIASAEASLTARTNCGDIAVTGHAMHVGWLLWLRSVNAAYIFAHQFIGQHVALYNFCIAVLLLSRSYPNGPDTFEVSRAFPPWALGALVICGTVLVVGLLCLKVRAVDKNVAEGEARTAEWPLVIANISLFAFMMIVYWNLTVYQLVGVMLVQQFAVTIVFLPKSGSVVGVSASPDGAIAQVPVAR